MDITNVALNLPAEPAARINYMYTLASLEDYQLPTLQAMSVQEMISQKIFTWYNGINEFQKEERVGYYSNYE